MWYWYMSCYPGALVLGLGVLVVCGAADHSKTMHALQPGESVILDLAAA